jgi:hypothetical protein
MLPDGRIWVQGFHAAQDLVSMTPFLTSGGAVEQPLLAYSSTPLNGQMANGGALVLDCGRHGAFVVSVKCDGKVEHRARKFGGGVELRLYNGLAALRGASLNGRWLMRPVAFDGNDDGAFGQVFIEGAVDGPYHDAACMLHEELESVGGELTRLSVVGPYLGLRHMTSPDEDTAAEAARGLKVIEDALASRLAPPSCTSLKVRVYQVPAGIELSAGLVEGEPAEADVAQLEADGGVLLLSRTQRFEFGQSQDLYDLKLQSLVTGYSGWTSKNSAAADPETNTVVTGAQLRFILTQGQGGRAMVQLRAGVITGEGAQTVDVGTGDGAVRKIQRSLSGLTQLESTAGLKPGQSFAAICPSAQREGGLIVIVIERMRE